MKLDTEGLETVLVSQRQDLAKFLSRSRLIARNYSAYFDVLMHSKLASVITGVRRSGKSTLCLQELDLDSTGFVNFDDDRLMGLTTQDLDRVYGALVQLNPGLKVLFFDEIQNIEGWELFVNRMQRKGIKVVITGSNGRLLAGELATHLTGRHLSLELFPFSFHEYLTFHQIRIAPIPTTEELALIRIKLEAYMQFGGFPEVVQGEPSGPYLRELFDRIISRDIVQRRALRNSKTVKELALYLVQNSGCLASYRRLARLFEIKNVRTLINYITYLEDAYLVQGVLAYSNKIRERLSLPRKIYAIDTGLVHAHMTKPTPDRGADLETLVFLQLRSRTKEIYYYHAPTSEVDFVICNLGKPQELIQVCWSMRDPDTQQREFKGLVGAAKALRVKDCKVITWDEEGEYDAEGLAVIAIPIWKYLLEARTNTDG